MTATLAARAKMLGAIAEAPLMPHASFAAARQEACAAALSPEPLKAPPAAVVAGLESVH